MNYQQAHYLMSAPQLQSCPEDIGTEVAFAGRSNAGKSSALNALTRQTKLARTSKTPGRTQLINFFSLTEESRLVDLPGYGYAKVPPAVKAKWQRMMADYFAGRQSLTGVVIVMDSRHPLKPVDTQMLDWCNLHKLPSHLLLTKADKLSKNEANRALFAVKKYTQQQFNCSVQLFSSLKKSGLDTLEQRLDELLKESPEATGLQGNI